MGSVELHLQAARLRDLAVDHLDGHAYSVALSIAESISAAAALREQPEARGVVDAKFGALVQKLIHPTRYYPAKPHNGWLGWRMEPHRDGDWVTWDEMSDAILSTADEAIPAITAAQQPVQEGGGEVVLPKLKATDPDHSRAEMQWVFGYNAALADVMCLNRRTAPPSAPVGVCQRCAGSGTVAATDTTRGPDGHDFDANCPRCDGTGDVHRADGEWLGTCVCAATQQPAQAAPGWKLVPVEPTMEMRSGTGIHHVHAENVWRTMLAAAPTPPGDDAAGGG